MQGQQNYLPYPILGLKEKWDFAFELSFTMRRAEQVIWMSFFPGSEIHKGNELFLKAAEIHHCVSDLGWR